MKTELAYNGYSDVDVIPNAATSGNNRVQDCIANASIYKINEPTIVCIFEMLPSENDTSTWAGYITQYMNDAIWFPEGCVIYNDQYDITKNWLTNDGDNLMMTCNKTGTAYIIKNEPNDIISKFTPDLKKVLEAALSVKDATFIAVSRS